MSKFTEPNSDSKQTAQKISIFCITLLSSISLITLCFFTFKDFLAVFTFGVLSLLNLKCMDTYFLRLIGNKENAKKITIHFLYTIRFLALLSFIWIGIGMLDLSVIFIVFGLSIPIMSFFIFGITETFKSSNFRKV
ncbi:MAG: hypothetical protein VX794_06030 [Nitrospinota bacterium]|nr:hypothetical protein [Nitrospinota bacterium]